MNRCGFLSLSLLAPVAANDDAQGAFCAIPICTRCQAKSAFVRDDESAGFCAECWLKIKAQNDSSFAAATPGENVTAAVKPAPAPGPSAAVTPPSKEPDVLALLFCAPFRRSSDITKGDRPGTELTALEIEQRLEPVRDLDACSSERDGFGATSFSSLNSFSGIGSARETSAMLHPGAADGSTTKLAGRDSGDRAERRSQNSIATGNGDRPSDVQGGLAVVGRDSNTPEAPGTAREAPCTGCGTSSDVGTQSAPRPLLDFEAEVSALEARGFAPLDENSKSVAASN
jgi:hypothetical protein